jgi:CubicO group peptidase (beta-lactamase class C family)
VSLGGILERYRRSGLYTHAFAAYGRLDDAGPRTVEQVGPDHRRIFDLASLTKALATVPLVFAQGLPLDQTVFDWAPALRGRLKPELGQLTIQTLLRHEAGLPAWRNFWVCRLGDGPIDRMKRFERILEGLNRLDRPVPARQVYSDVGFLLLGLVLEARSGKDLAEQLGPIGGELAYNPLLRTACVPTAYCPSRGRLLVGEAHDENCAALGGVTGHAGLFGTGEAICRFLHHYIAGTPAGRQLLAAQAAAVVLPPPGDPSQDSLLGWRQGSGPSSAVFGGGGAVGHPGFTGTSFWIDPVRRDYVVLLTNRVLSGRSDLAGIAAARREIHEALARRA